MKSVCICASQRFKGEVEEFANRLRGLGVPVVFQPNFKHHRKEMIEKPEAERLQSKSYAAKVPGFVFEHFNKLRKSDVCYVFNKDGYAGVNTTLEIGFAHGRDMIIYSYEPELATEDGGEPCRDILFTDIIKTPEELFHKLSATDADGNSDLTNQFKDLKEGLSDVTSGIKSLQKHLGVSSDEKES